MHRRNKCRLCGDRDETFNQIIKYNESAQKKIQE